MCSSDLRRLGLAFNEVNDEIVAAFDDLVHPNEDGMKDRSGFDVSF